MRMTKKHAAIVIQRYFRNYRKRQYQKLTEKSFKIIAP